ncbi:hypothetical protein SAMN04487928_10939 [Butyrivibrio proteoclasticus]|uniref:Uncharacterized protein n=1 Tax=Butyrivibrio proteoclasticus TaxID=43305 RepID=A0A1I5THK8_9FIRM|nr:hypothetical protein [Butyrivibrio proteoclasticus]SFP82539.1 hypothetical protein SAMN04487928_10939 [Butyrivibrio proteoclasticus]
MSSSIQGISTYQMRLQSLSTKVNELSRVNNLSSQAAAAALEQQVSTLYSRINAIKSSNTAYMLKQSAYAYDKNAQLQNQKTSSFEVLA